MTQLRRPRVTGVPATAPDRRLLRTLSCTAAMLVVLLILGGCAGDRDEAWMEIQRDTMSHGGTEGSN